MEKFEVGSVDSNELATSRNEETGVKELFGHSVEIEHINEGEAVPVGGSSMFSTKMDYEVIADYGEFDHFFNDCHQAVVEGNLEHLKEKLNANNMDIDEKLFAVMYSFSQQLGRKYLSNSEFDLSRNESSRKRMFQENDKKVNLSSIFEANVEECAEIAILAQGFLQREGIESSYVGGEVLWGKNNEYGEPHSYLVINHGDSVYIYDPANPMENKRFPAVYKTREDFNELINQGSKIFVTSENIKDKSTAYYGVGNMTLIDFEKHVV